jgi:flagellar biosynthesis GTPase FlhF
LLNFVIRFCSYLNISRLFRHKKLISRLLGNQGPTATKDQGGGSGKVSSLGSVFRGLSTATSTTSSQASQSQPSQSQPNKNASSSTNNQASQSYVSEEEKKQRREMLTKAANERSAQWEKKVATAKLKTKNVAANQQHNNNFSNEITNPETLKVIQKTKEQEENREKVSFVVCSFSFYFFFFVN